jgi:hypothetical protein
MKFRQMTDTDVAFVAEHSVSRGILGKQPEKIDWDYCLEHEGKVLAVGGIHLVNMTTAWGWIELTSFSKEHTVTVYRVIKEWMEICCKNHGIKRLMAYVDCEYPEGVRTVEHLGFHQESIMPMFIDDKSAYLFIKFYGD